MKRHIGLLTAVFLLLALAIPATAQEETDISVNLTPYEGNPILTPDQESDWERGGIWRPRVIAHNGLLHMFYLGFLENQMAGSICYATSEDGVTWTKHAENPIFVPDETAAPNGLQNFSVLHDGENWILYFTPWREGRLFYELANHILMATAPSPTGPWSISEEPVLNTDNALEWDFGGLWPLSVVHTANEYALYFENNLFPWNIGMATSPDGIAWTKYDDPATESGRYVLSDPVFRQSTNSSAWDSGYVTNPVVRRTGDGWEMFYGGGKNQMAIRGIGYATSSDGITWTRRGDTPLLAEPARMFIPEATIEVNGIHYLYYVNQMGWYPPSAAVDVAIINYE